MLLFKSKFHAELTIFTAKKVVILKTINKRCRIRVVKTGSAFAIVRTTVKSCTVHIRTLNTIKEKKKQLQLNLIITHLIQLTWVEGVWHLWVSEKNDFWSGHWLISTWLRLMLTRTRPLAQKNKIKIVKIKLTAFQIKQINNFCFVLLVFLYLYSLCHYAILLYCLRSMTIINLGELSSFHFTISNHEQNRIH